MCIRDRYLIPPQMQSYLTGAITIAVKRMRSKGVLALVPEKTVVAGLVDTLCFDKTGTLTTTSIGALGFIPSEAGNLNYFGGEIVSQPVFEGYMTVMTELMSCCHTLLYDEQSQATSGDPLEVEMFRFTGSTFSSRAPPQGVSFVVNMRGASLSVLKIFEFSSDTQRMSVVAYRWSDQTCLVYSKGSPEKIAEMCIRESLPDSYNSQLEMLTMKGYRVLAAACKRVNYNDAYNLERKDCESNLYFLGFIVFENKLKHDTKSAIAKLLSLIHI
eukprot:TRINITY_DN9426_c0_g1_i4.p2 TRINITY_DN9426_c0_g1~~TRINITY_DN9426_c0_g1_i4.p2  ORF type:complete len:292 (-),score=49.79 TRINITY_DN9426_c0_g1_i4:60-875(-)